MLIFLLHQKHQNEFNESAALRELYKYMHRYFTEVRNFAHLLFRAFVAVSWAIFRHFEATEIL